MRPGRPKSERTREVRLKAQGRREEETIAGLTCTDHITRGTAWTARLSRIEEPSPPIRCGFGSPQELAMTALFPSWPPPALEGIFFPWREDVGILMQAEEQAHKASDQARPTQFFLNGHLNGIAMAQSENRV